MDELTEEQRKNSDPRLANLKPFRPGETGNPGGRPKGRSLTSRLRDLLDAHELGGKPLAGKQVADVLTEVIVKGALKGDVRLIAMIMDRVDGKVAEAPPESGGEEKPKRIKIPGADERPQDDPG